MQLSTRVSLSVAAPVLFAHAEADNARTDAAQAAHAAPKPSMIADDHLILGSPSFTDPHIASYARNQGLDAAWQRVMGSASVADALCQVQGSFAVAVRGAGGAADRVDLAVDRFAIESLC